MPAEGEGCDGVVAPLLTPAKLSPIRLMFLFLLSLTGIPPTAGFFGELTIIVAAVDAGAVNPWMYVLAVVTMVNAAIAAFYYLRVAIYMYMRDPDAELPKLRHGRLIWAGLRSAPS